MIRTQRSIYLTVLGALWAVAAGAQTARNPGGGADLGPVAVVRLRVGVGGPTGHHHGRWRYRSLVCANSRSSGEGQVVRERLPSRPQLPSKASPTWVTSRSLSASACQIMPRSSGRSGQSAASIATCARSSAAIRKWAASSAPIRSSSKGWSGSQIGDFLVGVKFNILSEADKKPAAVAVRGIVKLPTASKTRRHRHGQDRRLPRLHREQGRRLRRRNLRLRRRGASRQSERRLAVGRIPLRRGRGLSVAQPAAADDGVQR